jgi:succinoglycan biosynthesis protein ExoA
MTRVLIVIPTLNEARHIATVIAGLLPFAREADAPIVVADGGSDDGTQAIVSQISATEPRVRLLHNPGRLQADGINLAVQVHGADADWLIRIDAHSRYPQDYCATLMQEARATGADSVVVRMKAEGEDTLQDIIARTQNSRLGNGGAAHRNGGAGRWVEHGHHALFRLSAFRAVGGYAPGYSHNEDAEFDLRFTGAGYRIWLTSRTVVSYHPRATLPALAKQYYRFGRGRARTMQRHRIRPRARQAVLIALAPLAALALLFPLAPALALPFLTWALVCLLAGALLAMGQRDGRLLASGAIAALMQLAWSVGFWRQTLRADTGLSGRQVSG